MHAIISIHDVMPCHMEKITRILAELPEPCNTNLIMLVVPGLDWQPAQLDLLRRWQEQGRILAGHGWLHQAGTVRNLYHRVHAALISRNAAEHLSLSETDIAALITRNFQWFKDHGLAAPDYYVPPAWAMGRISRPQLRRLPYRYYETTAGIYDSESDHFRRLPLSGYEADTAWRKYSLWCWNELNCLLCSRRRPVRISIHPSDYSLRLATSLRHHLSRVSRTSHYCSLTASA